MSDQNYNINVFIITKENSSYKQQLVDMFRDTNGLAHSTSKRITCTNINILNESDYDKSLDQDYCLVKKAITLSNEENPNSYTIICKENTTTTNDAETIYNIIEQILDISNKNQPFDIFYMANFLDNCIAYTNAKDISGGRVKIVNTESPNGIMSLMFTPKGKCKFLEIFKNDIPKKTPTNKKTLGHYIQANIDNVNYSDNKFNIITSNPRIFHFNIYTRNSDDEFQKLIDCKYVPPKPQTQTPEIKEEPIPVKETPESDGYMIFWIIISVIILIIVIWLIYSFSMNPHMFTMSQPVK